MSDAIADVLAGVDRDALERVPLWIYRRAYLPDPEKYPAQIADVVLTNGFGEPREIVAIVFRTGHPYGGIVITGHSGARSCWICRQPISPLEGIVLTVHGAYEYEYTLYGRQCRETPELRLQHDACFQRKTFIPELVPAIGNVWKDLEGKVRIVPPAP